MTSLTCVDCRRPFNWQEICNDGRCQACASKHDATATAAEYARAAALLRTLEERWPEVSERVLARVERAAAYAFRTGRPTPGQRRIVLAAYARLLAERLGELP